MDLYGYNDKTVDCQALDMLAKVKPAKESHVRNFVLNQQAVNYLPALISDLG